ncbi:XVIPCD domain-containing protein, partial [Variovorax sp. DXTD-1]|uniref:XVIPCD domain-containing protein n=1 Tax=Variovorax sp. DXTD-1 TaxID=2495592 RepID=UPI001C8E2991
LYEQALHKLEKYSADHPGFMDAQQIKNAAAALAVETHMHGLKKIDVLEPNDSGDKLIAAQGKLGTAQSKVVDVSKEQAANTPLEQSSKAYHEKPQNHQHPHQPTQADQTQGQGVPALAR